MPSITPTHHARRARVATVLLWIAQSLLAALFLFAGAVKLVMPLGLVAQMTGFPVAFLRFIAVAELLGALGLILPGALHIRRELTPLAAIGLVGVMTGATVATAAMQGIVPAVFPLFVGGALIAVAGGRRQWARRPLSTRRERRVRVVLAPWDTAATTG
jgi:hypothetical protein